VVVSTSFGRYQNKSAHNNPNSCKTRTAVTKPK
jgi:hypothetical protein